MKLTAATAMFGATLVLSACGGASTSPGGAGPAVIEVDSASLNLRDGAGDRSAPSATEEGPDALTVDVEIADDGPSEETPAVMAPSAPAAVVVVDHTNQANDLDFERILNGLRAGRGLSGLTYDARLDAAAEKYAIEQASISGLSHTGVNGSSVYDRIVAEGYSPRGWAENLAKGYQTQEAVLQAWINSDGHNKNLNANLEDFAIGVAGNGGSLSWVLVLATER